MGMISTKQPRRPNEPHEPDRIVVIHPDTGIVATLDLNSGVFFRLRPS